MREGGREGEREGRREGGCDYHTDLVAWRISGS